MSKKRRGTYKLSGVGTRVEQHAERVVRLAKMDAPQAKIHAYESLSILKQRAPGRFNTLMADSVILTLYEGFEEKKRARREAVRVAPEPRTGAVAAERRRRRLSLNGAGTPCEQHTDRVNRLWSVLLEGNHNLYQARTREAFAESMKWLEENEPDAFQTLIESLAEMPTGEDAYFIYICYELRQVQKAFEAANGKPEWELLQPGQRTRKGRRRSQRRGATREGERVDAERAARDAEKQQPLPRVPEPETRAEPMHPAQLNLLEQLEG